MGNQEEQKTADIQIELVQIVNERERLRIKLSRAYYNDNVMKAKEMGKKIIYFPSAGYPELAYAFEDCVPVMPSDNYSIHTCVRHQQRKYLERAEAEGMSPDICSYDRLGMGLMLEGEGAFGPLPPPDVIIGLGNLCETHCKLWEIVSDYYGNVPYFYFDLFTHQQDERLPDHAIEYAKSQVKRALNFIAEHTGKKLDWDRFKEVMKLSTRTLTDYWENVIELRTAIPSPWSTMQCQNDLFFLVCYLGTPEAKQYLDLVAKEVKFRVDHKMGVNPKEKFRLLYTDIPPWFWMSLMRIFHNKGATLACEAYPTTFWLGILFDKYNNLPPIYELDPDKPEETLALRIINMSAMRSMRHSIDQYVVATEKYHLDGAVMFSNRTCPVCTRALPLREKMYREKTGKPTMSFQGEHCDDRTFSESQTLAKIDAFFETLERRKEEERKG